MFDKSQPLWLPRGSVRSILALTAVGAFLFAHGDKDTAMLVVGFYFGSRTK